MPGTATSLERIMKTRSCPQCGEVLAQDGFRKGARNCVWCAFSDMRKRAVARYADKVKLARARMKITREEFVAWYIAQPDACAYCGISFQKLKALRLKRGGGYCVGWDIDRIDSKRGYEPGNLALSCFVCNMAKGDLLTAAEARISGIEARMEARARARGSREDEESGAARA